MLMQCWVWDHPGILSAELHSLPEVVEISVGGGWLVLALGLVAS